MALALSMLWLGCGIFLTTITVAALWTGANREGWLDPIVAGVMGIAFFATAWMANLPWLRWIAVAWWLGEVALFAAASGRGSAISAALMLLLLMDPGSYCCGRASGDDGLRSWRRTSLTGCGAIVAFLAGPDGRFLGIARRDPDDRQQRQHPSTQAKTG
jgi:hypothetical protein